VTVSGNAKRRVERKLICMCRRMGRVPIKGEKKDIRILKKEKEEGEDAGKGMYLRKESWRRKKAG